MTITFAHSRTNRRSEVFHAQDEAGQYMAVVYVDRDSGEVRVTDVRRDLPRGTGTAIRQAYGRDQFAAEMASRLGVA